MKPDKGKEPCKEMAQNQTKRYAAEKRLQLLLNKKFEMLEKLHPLISGEPQETTEAYVKLFDCMDDVIVQEWKTIGISNSIDEITKEVTT